MTDFKNRHLSFSRLSRFEQCPLSFKLNYIDQLQANPGIAVRFGKALHAVLEILIREHIEEERVGLLSEERAADIWQQAWTTEGLSRLDLFEEGLGILRSFTRDQGAIDHQDVLAVEKEFRIPIGPFTVLGFIDRVDRIDDDGVEVLDYKSNRVLFTRDELDASLQLGLYALAVKQLWPWATKIKLTYHMLRHGLRMSTERTPEQLDAVQRYVQTLGEQTETATEYPARLNSNCIYCDHRKNCPAYSDALTGKRDLVCEDLTDLKAVAKEREHVAKLAKILYARKQELEGVIKTHLEENDELELNGVRYRMFNTTGVTHPFEQTIKILQQSCNLPRSELIERLVTVDNKALDNLIKQLSKNFDRSRINLLKAELDAVAYKSYSPRFWGKEVAA